jgi:hypothetical protein
MTTNKPSTTSRVWYGEGPHRKSIEAWLRKMRQRARAKRK